MSAKGPFRVLLVDDDATVRALAEHHLGSAGFEVIALAEGGSVVRTFLEQRPDVVLLDVMLPDADGIDLCRALREIPEAAHLPIVILTSLNDEHTIQMAFEAGATEFVSKPIHWLHEEYRLRYLLRAAANLRDLEQTQRMIEHAKREWEKTFDAIEDPVLILNTDLTIRRANQAAARMTQLCLKDMIGRRCADILGCEENGADGCPAARALANGCPEHTDVPRYGTLNRDCLVSASPILDGDRAPVAVVYSIKDVTEYRELQRELLHAQKMEALGVLAAGVAHDFNNLLQGILGWADVLSRETPTQAELQEGLAQMSGIASKGRALTHQLLFTSRKAEGQKRDTAVGPLIGEVAALLSRTQPKTLRIETEVPGDLWTAHADMSHLHQALMNLGVNAAQAMPGGGCLRLQAANVVLDDSYCLSHPDCHNGPHVMITVADTGTGIDKTLLPRIYEPFFTTKAPGEGTGLGLSIVFGIVRDHGGHICCYSEPGQGTTFRIYLPALVTAQQDKKGGLVEAGRGAPAGEGKTVLVAEDEPLILGLLVRLLERQRYNVVQTANGKEALDHWLSNRDRVDAAVLDINMPMMNGDDCLKELVRHGCRAPVLLATGALLSAERQAELLTMASGIVMKPFHGRELLGLLEQTLAAGCPAETAAVQ